MRRLALPLMALALVPVTVTAQEVTCPDVEPPALAMGAPRFIDESKAGGEPVSVVAQDGSIIVSAHAGTTHIYKNPNAAAGAGDFLVGYANQTLNWRSADGGQTWRYIGTAGAPAGPHSVTSTGFSDPDLTMDLGGRIYNVEIDLANVAVFSSNDDGQSFMFATPEAASGDRPWLVGLEPDEVVLYVNLPQQLWRSTTAGLAWEPLAINGIPMDGKMIADPLNPEDGIIGPYSTDSVSISENDGRTWENYPGANLGAATQFFGTSAADRKGWIYQAAAGGYNGPGDTTSDGQVTFNYFDRRTKQWGDRVELPIPEGDALWPWTVAGDDGRAAVVWYQNLAGKPREFHIFVGYTTNAHGTTVECSDGTTRVIPPRFTVLNASGRPIHVGDICLRGTTCNANLGEGGDRRLGDFFTVNFTHKGELFIVSADTTLRNPLGGPKPVANPIFIKQTGGTPILERPDTVRPTRCVFGLPVC